MASKVQGKFLQGWSIVGSAAVAILILLAVIFAVMGIDRNTLAVAIRVTARTSLMLFLSAFIAAPLHSLWPTTLSKWLRANRRYLGLSFAFSHFIHAAMIIALAVYTAGESSARTPKATLYGGGLAYLFLFAMTVTSFDRTAAWLGRRAWKYLHRTGSYFIWFIFFFSYLNRIYDPFYAPFLLLIILAMLLRPIAYFARSK